MVKLLNNQTTPIYEACRGKAAGVISVKGTFIGDIIIEGAVSKTSAYGGRLVFRSGVGSLGTNVIKGYGDGIPREYRVVCGGYRLRFSAANWVSGTAEVEFEGTNDPSLIFVNEPIHTAEDEAVRNGRAYIASTGVQSVSVNQVLSCILANPTESGKNMILIRRLFSTSATEALNYTAFGNPTAILANDGVIPNRLIGGAPSAASFKFSVAASPVAMGGNQGSGEIIPANGVPRDRNLEVVIPPGNSIGFQIAGTGNLIQARNAGITLEWYEEDL